MEMRNVLNQVLIPYFSIFYLLTAPNFLHKFLCQSCRLFLALVIHNFRISKLAFDTGLWNGMPSGTFGKWDFAQPQLKYSTHCYHAILGSESLLAQWQLLCSREPGFQPKSVSKIDVHSTVHNASAPWRSISSSKGRSSLASSRVNCKVVMGTFTMLAGIIQIYVVTPFFSWWSVWMLCYTFKILPFFLLPIFMPQQLKKYCILLSGRQWEAPMWVHKEKAGEVWIQRSTALLCH